jgi:hypothetical protein
MQKKWKEIIYTIFLYLYHRVYIIVNDYVYIILVVFQFDIECNEMKYYTNDFHIASDATINIYRTEISSLLKKIGIIQ